MKNEKKKSGSLAVQKRILLIIHLAVFSVFVAGVSMIYCNANFKKGLQWMNSETYEESPAFNALLAEETAEILNYVRYRDVFESGGEVDYDNEVFAYSTGAGNEEIWTVNNVLEYAEQHGYYFDNDFNVRQDPAAPQGDGTTYPVTWKAYRSQEKLAGPGSAFVTLDYVDGAQQVFLNGENVTGELRTEAVGNMASASSVYPAVRTKLVELQRKLAESRPVVMDGRDIGTVVLPDAETKIYLTASVEVWAVRRYKELVEKGETPDINAIAKDIAERDYRDMHRETSPLKQAEDAVLVDSSDLTIPEVIEKILSIVRRSTL